MKISGFGVSSPLDLGLKKRNLGRAGKLRSHHNGIGRAVPDAGVPCGRDRLRISEALGLKWSDLDYERQMIHLLRVWVGNDLVPRLKTDGSIAPAPLGELLANALQSWHRNTLYAKPEDWVSPSTKMKGQTPLSASMMAKDKIRPAAIRAGIQLERGQRFGFHNFRHSLATFLISKGKDVMTIQGLLRHAKSSTTLDLYSQSIDAAKLEAQRDIALAITSTAAVD